MSNISTWSKGMKIMVCPADCSTKVTEVLLYEERNTLISDEGRKIWFNETLKPVPYEGLILDLDMDDSHICKSMEILKVE